MIIIEVFLLSYYLLSLTTEVVVAVLDPEDILSRYPGQNDYISPTTYLEAVAGHSAHLPCNLTSPLEGDQPLLVLWYKNGVIKPIYSYDMRSGLPTHWKNEKHIGNRGSFNALKGELVLQRVNNNDQNDYRCRVDFKVNPTLTYAVNLTVIIPPLDVQLLTKNEPFSAGKRYKIECEAIGSRPIADMEFALEGRTLLTHSMRTSEDGNLTIATLLWTPKISDSGKELTCKASSPSVDKLIFDSSHIIVHYKPLVVLQPGHSLDLSNIEEGDDVYFECLITADPPVHKIQWLLNAKLLHHNLSLGVIISNQSLVLQKVAKNASGKYICKAINSEGETLSKKILLKVKYTPVCKSKQILFHGAARLEQVHIPCHLDAHPMPSSYMWTFNNSGESVKIPEDHVKVDGFKSTVSYTPMTELDYGTLLCWGTNVVGKQRHPCVFHVFPAGRPDPVHNCSQFNLSDSAVNIRCSAGFDGGLSQTFVLELYDNHSSRLVANVTSEGPILSVSILEPATSFAAIIYSTNEKGSGERFRLQTYTLKDNAEKRTAAIKPAPSTNGHGDSNLSSLMVVILGIVGGLMLVSLAIGIAVKLRLKKLRRYNSDQRITSSSADTVNTSTSLAPIILKEPLHHSYEAEDINPDIISHADSPVWRGAHVHTISSSSMVGSYATLPRRASGQSGGNCPYGASVVPYADFGLPMAPSLQRTCTSGCGVRTSGDPVMYTAMDNNNRRLSQPIVIPPPPPQFASTQFASISRDDWNKSCSMSETRWMEEFESSFHCQKRFNTEEDDMKKSLLQGQHESSV